MRRLLTRMCLVSGLLLLYVGQAWALEDVRERLLHNAATADGDGQVLSLERFSTVSVEVTLTGTATVTFEGSTAGGGWTGVRCVRTNDTSGTGVLSATSTGMYQCNVAGFSAFHVPVSDCATCSVTVFSRATTGSFASGGAGGGSASVSATATDLPPEYSDGQTNAALSLNTAGAGLRTYETALLSGEDQDNDLMATSGGQVRLHDLAAGITTNTVSSANIAPTGAKTFVGQMDSAGAQTVTLEIWGGFTSTASIVNKELLCTISLSVAVTDFKACNVVTANYPFYVVKSTNITGSGTAKVMVAY